MRRSSAPKAGEFHIDKRENSRRIEPIEIPLHQKDVAAPSSQLEGGRCTGAREGALERRHGFGNVRGNTKGNDRARSDIAIDRRAKLRGARFIRVLDQSVCWNHATVALPRNASVMAPHDLAGAQDCGVAWPGVIT